MTVDELLSRMTAAELAEWQYLFGKEDQIAKAVREGGVDPEIARAAAFADWQKD